MARGVNKAAVHSYENVYNEVGQSSHCSACLFIHAKSIARFHIDSILEAPAVWRLRFCNCRVRQLHAVFDKGVASIPASAAVKQVVLTLLPTYGSGALCCVNRLQQLDGRLASLVEQDAAGATRQRNAVSRAYTLTSNAATQLTQESSCTILGMPGRRAVELRKLSATCLLIRMTPN